MSSNAFKDYLVQIGNYPLLDAQEELELGRRIKEDNDAVAREKLVLSNLRLVVYIAKTYKNTFLSLEDLVAEGNSGLMIAVDKFDYKLGYRFSTCATPWIKQAILKAITDKGRPIRLPAHIYQQLSQMRKYVSDYTFANGEAPTNAQIAKYLKITEEKVHSLLQWKQDTVSLDTPLDDEDKNTVADTIADKSIISPEKSAEKSFLHKAIQDILKKFPERTQVIMKMRYGLGTAGDPEDWNKEHTLEEIGAYVGITRERVRQIEKETLQSMKISCKDLM